MHSPFAHLKGVSDGQPISEGQTIFWAKQLPSGHNFLPTSHMGFSGHWDSACAQEPSVHLKGRLNGQPLSLSQYMASLIQNPLLHLYGKLIGHSSTGQSANFFLQVPSLHLMNSEGQSVSSLQLEADFAHKPLGHFTGFKLSHL